MSDRHTIARLTRQVLTLKAAAKEFELQNEKQAAIIRGLIYKKVDAEIRNEMALLALNGHDVEVKK